MVDNQVRLQPFVLAYNPGNFLRQAVLPRAVHHWTLTTLAGDKTRAEWQKGLHVCGEGT
jgi:hypothetical protein